MKWLVFVLCFSVSIVSAKQSWELTVLLQNGKIALQESRIIEGAPKESRRTNVQSGPASAWSWQILASDGSVLKESRFVLPDHYCSSEAHVEIDSVLVVLTIPQVEGGVDVAIVESVQGESLPSGSLVRSRSAGTVRATFALPGGNR